MKRKTITKLSKIFAVFMIAATILWLFGTMAGIQN